MRRARNRPGGRGLPGAAAALLAVALAAAPAPAGAGEVHVAVAASFTDAANEIGALFAARTGHSAVFSFASSGQLYTQITQGAPFEVLLAADQERPRRAVENGLGRAASRFTYATGRIVLYSADPGLVTGAETLSEGNFTKIAIANPQTAPYGAAAVEAMRALGVHDRLLPRFVHGNNVAQAYQFVATGNAELGFVALSQVATRAGGSRWVVPEDLHATIAQDAVLLEAGEGNEAAAAFIAFLKGEEARRVKQKFGYGADE